MIETEKLGETAQAFRKKADGLQADPPRATHRELHDRAHLYLLAGELCARLDRVIELLETIDAHVGPAKPDVEPFA